MSWNFYGSQPRVHVAHVSQSAAGTKEIVPAKAGHRIRIVYMYIDFADGGITGTWQFVEKTAAATNGSAVFQVAPDPDTKGVVLPPSPGWYETATDGNNAGVVTSGAIARMIVGYIYVRDSLQDLPA